MTDGLTLCLSLKSAGVNPVIKFPEEVKTFGDAGGCTDTAGMIMMVVNQMELNGL